MSNRPTPKPHQTSFTQYLGPIAIVSLYGVLALAFFSYTDQVWERLSGSAAPTTSYLSLEEGAFVAISSVFLLALTLWLASVSRRFRSRLAEGERHLHNIAEAMPGAVVEAKVDASGAWTFSFVGDRIEELLEVTAKAVLQTPDRFFERISPEDCADLLASARSSELSTRHLVLQFRANLPSGATKWIRWDCSVVDHSDGGRTLQGLLLDVTAEQKRGAIREGQSATLRRLMSTASLDEILHSVTQLAEANAADMRCSVMLVSAQGDRLLAATAPSMAPAFVEAIDGLTIGPCSGCCGAAAFHNRIVIAEDVRTDPLFADFRELAAKNDVRACWSAPIAPANGPVLGTFAMYYREPRRPSAQERSLIQSMADLAAVAISQRQGERALSASEQRYRQIVEAADEGIWLVNHAWVTIFVNNRMAQILGRTVEEIVGKPLIEMFDEQAQAAVRPLMNRRESLVRESRDLQFTRPDGAAVWALFNSNSIIGDDGRFAGAVAMVSDITKRKEVEQTLRESERLYRLLVEQTGLVIWQADLPEIKFTFVSDFAEHMFGYPTIDWYADGFWEKHVHPDDRAWAMEYCRQHVKRGKDHVFEYRMIAADGRVVWVRDFVSVDISVEYPQRLRGAMVDITPEKDALEALRQSEERYRSIIEDQTDLICRFTPDGGLTFANDAFCSFFAIEPQNYRSLAVWNLLQTPDDHSLSLTIRSLTKAAPIGGFEQRRERPDGTFASIAWSCRALVDESGRVVKFLAVGNDISELKSTQDLLLRTNRHQTLLLDELDHRVKNSLAGLLSLITLSERETQSTEELAASVRGRVETMAATHALLSSNHWRAVDLASLINRLIPAECPGGVQFDGPKVQIPPRQVTALGMIIQELMTNSLKYGALGAETGRLEIRWSSSDSPEGGVALRVSWAEAGGPPIEAPVKPKLGVRLIGGFARSELAGEAQLEFPKTGASHRLLFHLDEDANGSGMTGCGQNSDSHRGDGGLIAEK